MRVVKPPASGGFSAADGQAPSTAWAQLPRHGQRRGGQPPAPQPGAGLRPLAALPQLPSKSFSGPFLLHGPPSRALPEFYLGAQDEAHSWQGPHPRCDPPQEASARGGPGDNHHSL